IKEDFDATLRYKGATGHKADRRYWRKRSAHSPEPILDIDRRNTERGRSGCHARIRFKLKRADFIRLELAARTLGSTAFRAIIALTYAAFARVYDRFDIVLGVELANRSDVRAKQ